MRRALVLAAGLLLGACTVGPDFQRPGYPLPSAFRGLGPGEPPGTGSLGDLAWPQVFQDETLHGLIRDALEANYDLRLAAQRILDARAQVTIVRSFQFPEVGASSSAQYSRIEGDLASIQTKETFFPVGGLDVSYEVDFWGRFRRATEAARAELLASEEAQRFVVSSLVADVANAYLQLRALDLELEVARQTLASREGSLRLVTLRHEGGVSALIDVRQAEILVAGAAEVIPETERRIEQTENAISVLLGRNPAAVPRGRPLGEQIALTAVPTGTPAALVERRPDVREAEAQLHAATARIGVARSDFFPRVFLTGSAGAGGIMVNGSWFGPQGLFAIGPSLILPIFNMGRIGAGVDSAEARTEAARLQYEQTVQQALRDVSDGLVELRKRQEFRIQQEALTEAARDAVRLSNIRYTGGVTSYLEVLDSERQVFEANLGLVRSQRDEVLAVVRLYKAVGGGWQ